MNQEGITLWTHALDTQLYSWFTHPSCLLSCQFTHQIWWSKGVVLLQD